MEDTMNTEKLSKAVTKLATPRTGRWNDLEALIGARYAELEEVSNDLNELHARARQFVDHAVTPPRSVTVADIFTDRPDLIVLRWGYESGAQRDAYVEVSVRRNGYDLTSQTMQGGVRKDWSSDLPEAVAIVRRWLKALEL